MKLCHLDTASKTELGHINTMFYWFINLKMNVDYKTTLICGQPILECMEPYLMWSSIKTYSSSKVDTSVRFYQYADNQYLPPALVDEVISSVVSLCRCVCLCIAQIFSWFITMADILPCE